MEIANTAISFIMGLVTQVMGWANSFFGAVLPGSAATDEKKSQFVKYGLIVVGLFFAAQIFRVNIGGKSGGKK